MAFNPEHHHRRSIRLKGYDYSSPGAYFITICTYQRQCLFGEIIDRKMHLNTFGHIAAACWNEIPNHFRQTILDSYVIMPNHVHGILVITDKSCRGMAMLCPYLTSSDNQQFDVRRFGKPMAQSVSTLIGSFKSAVTKRTNILRDTKGRPVWQRNYYDHIIHNKASLHHIRTYIQNNPASWQNDQLHSEHASNQ